MVYHCSVVDKTFVIDREFRESLKSEIYRTGVTPRQFMKMLRKPPEGLETRTITRWLSGEVWHANQAHIEYVLRYYAKLPDRLVPPTQGDSTNKGWIEITPEMVEALRSELKRTGLSLTQLAGLNGIPASLTIYKLQSWRDRSTGTASPELWGAAMAALVAQPDATPVPLTGLTKLVRAPRAAKANVDWEVVNALRAHKQRTRTGAKALLKDWGAERPDGLTSAIVDGWLRGRIHKAEPELLRVVLERYASLPDDDRLTVTTPPRERKVKARRMNPPIQKPPSRQMAYVPITQEWLATIKAHCTRTGVYSHVFIRDWADRPPRLSFGVLESWLTGKTRKADPALLAAVMHRYEGLPGK